MSSLDRVLCVQAFVIRKGNSGIAAYLGLEPVDQLLDAIHSPCGARGAIVVLAGFLPGRHFRARRVRRESGDNRTRGLLHREPCESCRDECLDAPIRPDDRPATLHGLHHNHLCQRESAERPFRRDADEGHGRDVTKRDDGGGSSVRPPSEKNSDLARMDPQRLLDLMRAGDRDALAEFLDRYGDRIRARVRVRLSPELRRLADSQDLLATVARRLDRFVYEGKLRAAGVDELWSLVMTTAQNAVLEKRRVMIRLNRMERADSVGARSAMRAMNGRASQESLDGLVGAALDAAGSDLDRAIVSRWLAGDSLRQIGETLGLSSEATRQRWRSIRLRLRDALEDWGNDDE